MGHILLLNAEMMGSIFVAIYVKFLMLKWSVPSLPWIRVRRYTSQSSCCAVLEVAENRMKLTMDWNNCSCANTKISNRLYNPCQWNG